MRRSVLWSVLVLATASVLTAAETVPELFQKMKEQVKAEKWTDALATIEVIDVEAAKKENASLRPQLEGPLAFYRGVCEANAGNAAKAQASFESYLRAQPNASMDEKMYSKKCHASCDHQNGYQRAACCRAPSIGAESPRGVWLGNMNALPPSTVESIGKQCSSPAPHPQSMDDSSPSLLWQRMVSPL